MFETSSYLVENARELTSAMGNFMRFKIPMMAALQVRQVVVRRIPVDVMLEHLDPDVFFEVDVYWVQTAGQDPAQVVRRLGTRAPLLHVKDGPCQIEAPMTALGEGVVDIPGVVAAGSGSVDWLVVELDRCDTDIMEAIRKSYQYLVGKGLGRGNKN